MRSVTADLSERGDVLFASWPKHLDEFIPALRNSSKLRAEINLPWAGNVLVEFTTKGADKIMDRLACEQPMSTDPTKPIPMR